MRNLVITQNDNKGGTVIIIVPAIFYVDIDWRTDPKNDSKDTIRITFCDANRKSMCISYLNTTFYDEEDHFNALNSKQKEQVASYMKIKVFRDVINFLSSENEFCVQGEIRTEYFELPRYECQWASYLQKVSKNVLEKENQSKDGQQTGEGLDYYSPF